jgi:hypothetical protein
MPRDNSGIARREGSRYGDRREDDRRDDTGRDDDHPGDDDSPRSRPRRKQGMSTATILLIIGGSVLALFVLCGGVTAVIVYAAYVAVDRAVEEAKVNMGIIPPGKGKIILSQQGQIGFNDPVRDGKRHKAFQVPLEKGKTYVIDMVSDQMDSYLVLYDPAGRRVAEDDDSAGFLNARIRYTPTDAGNYTVAATSLGGQEIGPFTLTVREDK